MKETRLKDELEEQDFSSIYRMDVYTLNIIYTILEPKDSEDQKDIPFSGTDNFTVEKSYSVYMLDQKQVSQRVKWAVEFDAGLYTIRVYEIPLNLRVDNESKDISIFNSKGEMVENSEREMFKAGEIVEYHDLEEGVVRLAVVYEPPKIVEDHESSEDSDNVLYNQVEEDYKLITVEGDLCYISASCVSRPSFPVADAFKKKLESVYKKKVEEAKNGNLSFNELLDLL